ncbi:MAG: hypothetical protein L6Q51_13140 [Cyclobacteriaceae bacterium]|nr:hypothetical protein [Cyclobacteriaceae bacterium]
MKNLIILSVLILTLYLDLFGQEDIHNRFSISVSGGRAIPVGSFGNKDIFSSAIYTPEDVQNPWVIGIDKSKSGFAEVGYFANLEMKYMLNKPIGLRLRTGYTFNSVWTDGITQFLSTNYGDQKFEHDDYKIFHAAPGIGYEKQIGNFNLGVGLYSGVAITNYPYYESILTYTTTNPHQKWAHDGDRPNLKALLLGASINIDYQSFSKLNWGIELSYQRSNFDYSMTTRVIPGFSPNPEINDILKTSNLNIGLRLQYNFANRQ